MQNRVILNKEQVDELVRSTIYLPKEDDNFLSRCIDGRYPSSNSLPPVAIPGGDIGELAVLYAASNAYSFEVDHDKAFKVLADLVGGVDKLSYHTDSRVDAQITASGCGHLAEIRKEPQSYSLEPAQVKVLDTQADAIKKMRKDEIVLQGDHREGAVVVVLGKYGVMPQATVTTDHGDVPVQTFIYHRSLVDARRKVFAEKLFEAKAVTMIDGLDEEYLYEVLTDTGDTHVFETARRLANGLPLFMVTIDESSRVKVEELENI